MNETNKSKVDECKQLNKKLWDCIETNNNKVMNCGEYYYNFIKCFNKIDY